MVGGATEAGGATGYRPSGATVRLGDMIRPFDGKGDVVGFLTKARLVARLQNIERLETFLPLFLEGAALALYLEMDPEDQGDVGKIEDRLKEAFTEGPFAAFDRLTNMKWAGDSIDVYANNIRCLAGLVGFKGEGLELMVRQVFVRGLPERIAMGLRQVQGLKDMKVSDLINATRPLVEKEARDTVAVAARGVSGETLPGSRGGDWGGAKGEPRGFRGRCFRCNGPHMARHCKEPRPPIVCYRCNKAGHIASQCVQGNEQRGAAVPAVTPQTE